MSVCEMVSMRCGWATELGNPNMHAAAYPLGSALWTRPAPRAICATDVANDARVSTHDCLSAAIAGDTSRRLYWFVEVETLSLATVQAAALAGMTFNAGGTAVPPNPWNITMRWPICAGAGS